MRSISNGIESVAWHNLEMGKESGTRGLADKEGPRVCAGGGKRSVMKLPLFVSITDRLRFRPVSNDSEGNLSLVSAGFRFVSRFHAYGRETGKRSVCKVIPYEKANRN